MVDIRDRSIDRLRRHLRGRDTAPQGQRDLAGSRGDAKPQEPPARATAALCREHEVYTRRCGFPVDLFGDGFDGRRLDAAAASSRPIVFWDLETCGLGDVPIFLAGLLTYERPGSLSVEMLLARGPEHEAELLAAAAARLGQAALWVSFNGRSFDHPRLRKRAFRHALSLPEPAPHLDLLIQVRRRFRDRLPNCRLGTVERRLLGLERGPRDIPGAEVPHRYRDFVRTGERRWLDPVIEHNRRDLIAMVVLLERLCEIEPRLLEAR